MLIGLTFNARIYFLCKLKVLDNPIYHKDKCEFEMDRNSIIRVSRRKFPLFQFGGNLFLVQVESVR
jgi:hypothetical protein